MSRKPRRLGPAATFFIIVLNLAIIAATVCVIRLCINLPRQGILASSSLSGELPTLPAQTAAAPTLPPETFSTASQSASGVLLNDPVPDSLCICIRPTERSAEDRHFYALCPDQAAATAAFDAAYAKRIDGKATNGEALTGLMVHGRDGMLWYFTESGALCNPWERIEAEDAADLHAICLALAREVGYREALRPNEIRDLTSATMVFNDQTRTVTDSASLAKIEKWLSTSTPCGPGGASCWFTAFLTLETADGNSHTVAIATDSCSTWITEGICYEYPSENEDLFSLFSMPAPDET